METPAPPPEGWNQQGRDHWALLDETEHHLRLIKDGSYFGVGPTPSSRPIIHDFIFHYPVPRCGSIQLQPTLDEVHNQSKKKPQSTPQVVSRHRDRCHNVLIEMCLGRIFSKEVPYELAIEVTPDSPPGKASKFSATLQPRSTASHAGGRWVCYVPPPAVSFTEMPPHDDLSMPTFSKKQMEAAQGLTKAIGLAPAEYDPVWRAILGSRMGTLLHQCANLKSTVLVFRTVLYSVDEKN